MLWAWTTLKCENMKCSIIVYSLFINNNIFMQKITTTNAFIKIKTNAIFN